VCRKHGLIWLDTKRFVPDLPPPYKPVPKFMPRKRKPQTSWYKDVAARAQVNNLSVSEQIEADKQRPKWRGQADTKKAPFRESMTMDRHL
jgi:hypothetical protein